MSGTPEPQVPGLATVTAASPGYGELLVVVHIANPNGSPVTSYTATCGTKTAPSTSRIPPPDQDPGELIVSGLTNGTQYSCTAYATNAIGNGPFGTRDRDPGTATPGTTVVRLDRPRKRIPHHQLRGSLQFRYAHQQLYGDLRLLEHHGERVDPFGHGNRSDCRWHLQLHLLCHRLGRELRCHRWGGQAGAPDAPAISSVLSQDGQLTVQYGAIGTSTTGYTATCGTQSVTVNGNTTWATVTGLTDGIDYSCTVVATNAAGSGPASAAASGTPSPTGKLSPRRPAASLTAVSCPSTSECVAVGAGGSSESDGLVELSSDGGTTFTDEPVPTGTPPLEAVSCFDTSHCVAVGGRRP